MPRNIRITRIISRADSVAYQLQGLHFSNFNPPAESWQPQVNAYSYTDRYEVCVELAGVDKEAIDLQVEPRQIVIRGTRESTEPPACTESPCRHILMMEIDSGPFARILTFSRDIDTNRVVARQEHGLLWITLPIVP